MRAAARAGLRSYCGKAVRLFAGRAVAVLPGFSIDADNGAAVAGICRALDGIPLAVELAAVRVRSLSPGQILSRLDARFQLLSGGGPADAPQHRMLAAALEWSYGLLTEAERAMWRRVSVFAGSFDLDAAEAVCAVGRRPGPGRGPGRRASGQVDPAAGREAGHGPVPAADTIGEFGLGKLRGQGNERRRRAGHGARGHDVSGRLMALVRKDLVRPDRAILPGEKAFRFRHLLIRDAAYEALSKADRAELHECFARWLEESGADLVGLDEIAGYHLEQAFGYRCELGPADEKARLLSAAAARHLDLAGRRAKDRGDSGAAVNLLERAEALLPPQQMNLALQQSLIRDLRSPAGSAMRSRARHGSQLSVPPPVTASAN